MVTADAAGVKQGGAARYLDELRGYLPRMGREDAELAFPGISAKPAALFLYMYIARLGFLNGVAGALLCFYHAWFKMSMASPRAEPVAARGDTMTEARMAGGAEPLASASAWAVAAEVASGNRLGRSSRPHLGVLDFNPVDYHTSLYRLITRRARVELDVLFLTDDGHCPVVDPGFGVRVAWGIDMLSGYEYQFLTTSTRRPPTLSRVARLARWISDHDVVVVHGHSHPWMLLAVLLCRTRRIPYLLRGDSIPQGKATGLRRHLRNAVARTVVSASAGGLAIGQLNEEFYRRYGAPRIIWAPYSVDDERFASPPSSSRSELLFRWDLDGHKPVILFCGKLSPRKRPLDLCEAVKALAQDVNVLFVGDGVLADEVRACLTSGTGAITGFVNQSELPAYYHAADIIVLPSEWEPWGIVINEAMAAGALPVVSDRVGAGPDLVLGVGEVYPCGDVARFADALDRALALANDPGTRDRVQQHAARHCLSRTATGFEEAVFAVSGGLCNSGSTDSATR
jgi:glycosyltransferase involved in cell wall biosynthesis